MIHELVYASARNGLFGSSPGYQTVAASPSVKADPQLRQLLESFNVYKVRDDRRNPITYRHLLTRANDSVLSLEATAQEKDYSGRAVKLAHHLMFGKEESLPPCGPAAILLALKRKHVLVTDWKSDQPPAIRDPELVQQALLNVPEPSPEASLWRQVGGNIGTKGAAALAHHFRCSQKEPHGLATPAYIVLDPDDNGLPDPLELVAEACALLRPEERWRVTFSTYSVGKPPSDLRCDWRFCLKDDLTYLADRAKNKLQINLSKRIMTFAADESKVPEYRELCYLAENGKPLLPANTDAPGHGGTLTPAGGTPDRKIPKRKNPDVRGTSFNPTAGYPFLPADDHASGPKKSGVKWVIAAAGLAAVAAGAFYLPYLLTQSPKREEPVVAAEDSDKVRELSPTNTVVTAEDDSPRLKEMEKRRAEYDALQKAADATHTNRTENAGTAPRQAPAKPSPTYRLIAELSGDTVPSLAKSFEEATNHPFTVYCLTRNPLKAETGTYTPGYPSSKGGFSQASIRVSGKETPLATFDWVLYQSATGTVCHLYRPPGSQGPIKLPESVTYVPGLTKVEFPELGELPSPLLEAFSTLGCLDLGLYAGAAPAQDKEPFFWLEKLKLTDGIVKIPPGSRDAFKAYRERIETSSDPLLKDYCVKRKAVADKRQELKALDASAKGADADLRRATDAMRSFTNAITRAEQEIDRLDAEAKAEREFINELAKRLMSTTIKTVAPILRKAEADEKNAKTAEDRDKHRRFVTRLKQLADKYVDSQSGLDNNNADEKVKRKLEAIKKYEFECVEIKKLSEARQREISLNREIQERNHVTGKSQAQINKKESESVLTQAQAAADDYHAKLKTLPDEVKNSEDELKQALRALEAGTPISVVVIIDKPSNARGAR